MPDTLTIRVEPFEDFMNDALDAAEQLDNDPTATPDDPAVVSFDTAEQATRLLTPKRLELLESVMDDPPESIRALARRLDRNPSETHADLKTLAEYGIIDYHESGRTKAPYCPYNTINIDITLTVK